MNVFNKLTLKQMLLNKKRTVATIIGVILSASLFTAVISFVSSTLFNMENELKRTEGNYHITVRDIDKEELDNLSKNKDIKDFKYFKHIGYSKIKNDNKPYLSIEAICDNFTDKVSVKLTSGRMPQNQNEIILPSNLEKNGEDNYKLNEKINLGVGQRLNNGKVLTQTDGFYSESEKLDVRFQKTYKIVGFYKRNQMNPVASPGYSAFTVNDKSSTTSGKYTAFLSVAKPLKGGSILSDLSKKYGKKKVSKTLLFDINCFSPNSEIKKPFYILALIFIVIIFVGSVSLIYNSFSISVSSRTKEFGMLSSIGATRKQLLKSVLFEANAISIFGIALGILLGCAGMGITLWKTGDVFNSLLTPTADKFVFHISPLAILLPIIITYITVLISASIPLIKGTKVTPIVAIKENKNIKLKGKRNYKVSPLISKTFGFEGVLSQKYYKRSKSRYRTTIIALSLSVILFVCANSFVSYLNSAFKAQMGINTETFDYALTPESKSDKNSSIKQADVMNLQNILNKNENVAQTEISHQMSVGRFEVYKKDLSKDAMSKIDKVGGDGKAFKTVENKKDKVYLNGNIIFLDDESFSKILKANNIYKYENQALVYSPEYKRNAKGQIEKNSGISKKFSKISFSVYDSKDKKYEMSFENSTIIKNLPSISGMTSDMNDDIRIYLPISKSNAYQSYREFLSPYTLFIRAKDGKQKQLGQDIDNIVKTQKNRVEVFDFYEQREFITGFMFVLKVFSYGFTILISFISLANLFNVIYTNVMFRKTDLAVLRSIGMTESSIKKSTIFEALNYSLKSLFWGISLSVLLNYLMFFALKKGNVWSASFYMPTFPIIFSITGVVIVVFVTMLYFVKQMSNQNIIETIRNQNI